MGEAAGLFQEKDLASISESAALYCVCSPRVYSTNTSDT